MLEIDVRIDVTHPPERVWRALTDPGLLARWFAEAEVAAPGRVLFRPSGLPGFDDTVEVEVLDRRRPELLVLACRQAGRRTRLTWVLTPTVDGCRLTVREVPEEGDWPADDAARREECYQQTLSGRLQALLDWVAFQQVDLRRDAYPPTAELPLVAVARPGSAVRRRAVLVGAVAAAVVATGGTLWAVTPGGTGPTAGPPPAALLTPTAEDTAAAATSGSTRPTRGAARADRPTRSPGARPSPTPTASATSPDAALTARYRTRSTRLLGYTGEVVVDNTGAAAAKDWSVVVTLDQGAAVAGADGADWRQDGRTVTFSGAPVPPGGTLTFTFDVRDAALAKEPDSCTVGADSCAGL